MTSGLLQPRVLFPVILVTFIWGSTWLVIRDQIGIVPATWSVTYRFLIACTAMFAYARWTGASLRIGREGHLLALSLGIPQFFLNFNFVYAAEHERCDPLQSEGDAAGNNGMTEFVE